MYRVQLKVRDATKASRTDKHIIISVLSENDSIADSARHCRIAEFTDGVQQVEETIHVPWWGEWNAISSGGGAGQHTTQHCVKKTNVPLSGKQQVPLLPVQKFGVSVPYCNMQGFTD